jgi:hypothetical protein
MTRPDLVASEDLHRGPSRHETDRNLAISLEKQMKQLSEYLGEARIGSVRLFPDRIEVTVDMDFGPFVPSGQNGDWLATTEEVKAFRDGFKEYLQTESKTPRLSNLFFAEYVAFIRAYMRIYRFGKNVVRQLPKTAERRLAGRPRHALGRSDKQFLRKEIQNIKSNVLEMKKLIDRWNSESSQLNDAAVKARIREQYPRNLFVWMKFFFGSFKKLPAKYRGSLGRYHDKKLSNPASWSAADITFLIVQEGYYRKKGIELSILTLRELIPSTKAFAT